jgi:hypothetical protein
MNKESCWCDIRAIDPTAAFHYVDDRPVCSSHCYNTIMEVVRSRDPQLNDGAEHAPHH